MAKKNTAVPEGFPPVQVQKGALVGDDQQPDPRPVEPEVVNEAVPAQVAATPGVAPDEVFVHEVRVALDEVITDPSSPEAVQIPDAGRGFLDLPIHRLGEPTPEEKFASDSADATVNEGDGDTREGLASSSER